MLAFYIFLMQIFDLFAVYFGKMYSITDKWVFILLCSLSWAGSGVFFSLSMKYEGMAIVNTIWIALSAIAAVALGVLYFKEQIGVFQYIGIGVIIIGITLLFVKS